MIFKVEGLAKIKRFYFKLMERLNCKLSFTVLHSLINNCKEQKRCKQLKTKKKKHLWNDIGMHIIKIISK